MIATRPTDAYIDVHGVVADFVLGAHELFGEEYHEADAEYDFWQNWPDPPTDAEFWAIIDDAGKSFWADLPLLGAGCRLVYEVAEAGWDWCFLTAAVSHRGSYEGTVEFCKKHFGDCRVIGSERKGPLGRPGALLIDDLPDHAIDFVKAGGDAYVWPQPWNARHIVGGLNVLAQHRKGQ